MLRGVKKKKKKLTKQETSFLESGAFMWNVTEELIYYGIEACRHFISSIQQNSAEVVKEAKESGETDRGRENGKAGKHWIMYTHTHTHTHRGAGETQVHTMETEPDHRRK